MNTCQHCGKEHHRKKWCSNECKMESYKAKKREANYQKNSSKTNQCKGCNKEFAPKREGQIWCSKKCKMNMHAANQCQESATKRALVTKTCPICDKEFTPEKRITQKYCSRHCCYLIPKKCYKALQTCLAYMGKDKTERTHKLLGFTPDELQKSVKGHPNWEKVKDEDWHLDHIFPIIAFIDHGITDISVICSLGNLRPASAHENCKKNRKYSKKEFAEWIDK